MADAAVHAAAFEIERAVAHQRMDGEILAAHADRDGAGRERDRIGIGRDAAELRWLARTTVMVGEIGRRGCRMILVTAQADLAISTNSQG